MSIKIEDPKALAMLMRTGRLYVLRSRKTIDVDGKKLTEGTVEILHGESDKPRCKVKFKWLKKMTNDANLREYAFASGFGNTIAWKKHVGRNRNLFLLKIEDFVKLKRLGERG